MAQKRALVTGITGQDGSYLLELLLGHGYEVHGIIRRSSVFTTDRIDHLYEDPHEVGRKVILHYGDLTDSAVLRRVIDRAQPHEVYNLGAQSHVKVSFEEPEFGSSPPPQGENTPFHPRSPYGVSKVAAHWYGVNAREAYGLFLCNGILFNHESPRRGETFVTRKITRAVGRIVEGLQTKLFLGNLEARRDWGFAGDYVKAMWLMLQQDEPGDYVIASGTSHSVRDFVEEAFGRVDLEWERHVEVDPGYFRPSEVESLQGATALAWERLGWKAEIDFPSLVRMMVDHDVTLARQEGIMRTAGHRVAVRGAASI
jgi:GDPmannose 4,6-dehydratase